MLSAPASDDEGSTAATDGSTLRTSPAEHGGSVGSESGGSAIDSVAGEHNGKTGFLLFVWFFLLIFFIYKLIWCVLFWLVKSIPDDVCVFQCLAAAVLMGTQLLKDTLQGRAAWAPAQEPSALPRPSMKETGQRVKQRRRVTSTPATGLSPWWSTYLLL